MTDQFIKQVQEMRQAQRDHSTLATSKDATFKRHEVTRLLQRCKKLEADVDRALIAFKDQTRQMILLDLTRRTDESAGAYNVEHGTEKEQGSAT